MYTTKRDFAFLIAPNILPINEKEWINLSVSYRNYDFPYRFYHYRYSICNWYCAILFIKITVFVKLFQWKSITCPYSYCCFWNSAEDINFLIIRLVHIQWNPVYTSWHINVKMAQKCRGKVTHCFICDWTFRVVCVCV